MKRVKKKKKTKSQFTHNFCVHNLANWRWILGSCEQLPVSSVSKPTNDIVTRENKSRTEESGRRNRGEKRSRREKQD